MWPDDNSLQDRNELQKLLESAKSDLEAYLNKSKHSSGIFVSIKGQASSHEVLVAKSALKQIQSLQNDLMSKKETSNEKIVARLADILIKAKFQSLLAHLEHGVKPVALDKHLDNGFNLFLSKAKEYYDLNKLYELLETIALRHQAVAINHLYASYYSKTANYNHAKEDKILQSLQEMNQTIQQQHQSYKSNLNNKDPNNLLEQEITFDFPLLNEDKRNELNQFLKEARHEIFKLEPAYNIEVTTKMYEWGIKATSKLGGLVRKLDKQIDAVFNQDYSFKK